jgi:hypothetical protein
MVFTGVAKPGILVHDIYNWVKHKLTDDKKTKEDAKETDLYALRRHVVLVLK